MQPTVEELRPRLHDFDFRGLFVELLGWNNYIAAPFTVHDGGHGYTLTPVAEKANFVVWECGPGPDGAIPDMPARRRIEARAEKLAHEHLIVFTDAQRAAQVWQWVKREHGKAAAYRNFQYRSGDSGTPLLQRLQGIAFALEEEGGVTIAGVASRVGRALDVEKVTRRFYDRFKTELDAFGGFIDGIVAQGDRDWYASLMLNRMMFVYFIQKQGFLDNDPDYLRNRLRMVQGLPAHPGPVEGGGRFQQFYRIFLLRLFHEGLGQPEAQRASDLAALLGRVPFLNGGLFDVHDLERDNPDIAIPDEAFERVFDFFDAYQWHLDERPRRNDNEINPDVLGYIFEKYVNQKQMGAYYTKEDITGYISRNTVVPFLFDAARRECASAFGPDGGVRRLLRDDPDRYIYPAVAHGADLDLPDEIAEGLDDVSKRGGWNAPAPADYALPTETWREVVARRQRHAEVRAKLAGGEVTEINDLITLNLDIERFAQDVVARSEGPELVRAFWHALYGNRDRTVTGVSVLDPTCGSGAFLFAALNVLEPLYTACLEGMRGFLDDLERSERPRGSTALSDFRKVLDDAAEHPSERYFILKSIVLNNLYGVDIERGAVEICKLRLFLKLVAQLETYDQIEPLPDIDFNVRAGNTLVGFTSLDAVEQAMTVAPGGQYRAVSDENRATLARITERAEEVDRIAVQFRWQQTLYGGEITHEHKDQLRARLDDLNRDLNGYLADEHSVDTQDADAYAKWLDTHKPFHWFAEFYGIMSTGGFDVVIGNPPYVPTKSLGYSLGRYVKHRYPDIYAHVLQKSMQVTTKRGWCGMILPLSITFSRDFASLRQEVRQWGSSWLSSFDNIPAALFAGVSQRCTILLSTRSNHGILATRLVRWRAEFRSSLMSNITYTSLPSDFEVGLLGFPRLSGNDGERLLRMHSQAASKAIADAMQQNGSQGSLGFSPTARNFISTYLEPPPTLDEDGSVIRDTEASSVMLATPALAQAGLAATSGVVCFWYWLTRGDGFHVTNSLLSDYLAPLAGLPSEHRHKLQVVGELLHESRNAALVFKKNAGKYVGNFNYQNLRALTVRADMVFLAGLGANWNDVENLMSFSALVRSINEAAGERNIPQRIKAKFPINDVSETYEDERLENIDKWLAEMFNVPVSQVHKASII